MSASAITSRADPAFGDLARWEAAARAIASAPGQDENSADVLGQLRDAGLLRLPLPATDGGADGSLLASVITVEMLAGIRIDAALLLTEISIGAAPLLEAATDALKHVVLSPLAGGHAVFRILRDPDGSFGDAPGVAATRSGDGKGWTLRGDATSGPVVIPASSRTILFASGPGSGALSAFCIPQDQPDDAGARGKVQLAASADESMLIGRPGNAASLAARVRTVQRVLVAAQLLGLSQATLSAALSDRRAAAGSPPLRLADAMADLSATRLLLHQAARMHDAGEEAEAVAAMARIAATEASARLMRCLTRLMEERPDTDPRHLLRFLQARRSLGADVPPDAERSLLLRRDVPPPLKAEHVPMRTQPPARLPEPASRPVEILDAAADAFTRQSYDATTLDQIGDVLGVTKGSIYYHYRSKIDLFIAVYRRAMEMNIEAVAPIARGQDAPALRRLHRMAHTHSLQVMKHLSYQRVAVQGLELHLMGRATEEQRARLQEIISLRDEYEDLFTGVIAEAMDAGELPPLDPRLMVKPFFGAINWTTMWYRPRSGETAADRDALATRLADFVVNGLGQPSPEAMSAGASGRKKA